MAIKQTEGGTTYGPGWYDVCAYALEIHGTTGWKVNWDAHVESIAGRSRAYWKVHALRPTHLGDSLPPVITRGAFFPSVDTATVPALLHRLMAQVDGDIGKLRSEAPVDELPLFRRAQGR